MTPKPRKNDDQFYELRMTMLKYSLKQEYNSIADLVSTNPEFAKAKGRSIIGTVQAAIISDGKLCDYRLLTADVFGYQLTGNQLKIHALVIKAGTPIREREALNVHFDYVARIEREGRGYVAEFPDLRGCLTQGETIALVEEHAKEDLKGYISSKMLHGDTLPQPKYQGRKTKKVRPFKVQLTLADLVFEDFKEEVRDFTVSVERDAGFSKL